MLKSYIQQHAHIIENVLEEIESVSLKSRALSSRFCSIDCIIFGFI
jgi:hypothetical protein